MNVKTMATLVVGVAIGALGVVPLREAYASAPSTAVATGSAPQEAVTFGPATARARDFYAPNSEALAPDEMRVIACGTGMPTTRAAQAAA